MKQVVVEQLGHHNLNTAYTIEVDHVVLAVRPGIADVRHTPADPVEVLELELNPRLKSDGQQMQHRIGGAADRHRNRHRVLDRFLRDDLARANAFVH